MVQVAASGAPGQLTTPAGTINASHRHADSSGSPSQRQAVSGPLLLGINNY